MNGTSQVSWPCCRYPADIYRYLYRYLQIFRHLQDVGNKGVRCHAVDEVELRLLERLNIEGVCIDMCIDEAELGPRESERSLSAVSQF